MRRAYCPPRHVPNHMQLLATGTDLERGRHVPDGNDALTGARRRWHSDGVSAADPKFVLGLSASLKRCAAGAG